MDDKLDRRALLLGGGALAAGIFATPMLVGSEGAAVAVTQVPSPEARLRELGIELPDPPSPVATYVTRVQVGELLFTSGHGPDGFTGKLGRDMTVEQGQEAARSTGIRILSTVRDALGSLDRVVRAVQIIGMVNCTPDFIQQPQVINGCSNLFVEIFGDEAGKAARAAVGMVSLPSGIPVEIQTIWQVRS